MAYKNKKELAARLTAANVPAEDSGEILGMFDDLLGKDSEIAKIRQEKEDADKVVAKMPDLEKKIKERDSAAAELKAKLDALSSTRSNDPAAVKTEDLNPLGIFEGIYDFFFASDESAPPPVPPVK